MDLYSSPVLDHLDMFLTIIELYQGNFVYTYNNFSKNVHEFPSDIHWQLKSDVQRQLWHM